MIDPPDLPTLVSAAQRVAGIVAARSRGDDDGARELLCSFEDNVELASGALVVAELGIAMLIEQTGESTDECVRDLCLRLEEALAPPGSR